MAQTEKADKPETWYFKIGGSYFNQTASTEFPTVGGQPANRDVYSGTLASNKLVSREGVTGSFGQGFRSGITAGYRFSARLGVEIAANYYTSNTKTMAQTTDRMVTPAPSATTPVTYLSFTAEGQIKAFDVAPALVMFLGEAHGFEPYTKVGVIVPIHGTLDIETNRNYSTFVGANKVANTDAYSKDVVKPNPTLGFMASIGTSYKLGKHISAFAELEYRNLTVHGKTKETTDYTENGVDKLNTSTSFRAASYSANHTNYHSSIDSNSNNTLTNAAGFDNTKATDDLSTYVGISGLGLTLGLKYSL
jgi:hypothetical protein